jgi:hypothetical protein
MASEEPWPSLLIVVVRREWRRESIELNVEKNTLKPGSGICCGTNSYLALQSPI